MCERETHIRSFRMQENDAWFFAPTDAIRSLQELIQVYHNTVGNNGVLELDFGINTDVRWKEASRLSVT